MRYVGNKTRHAKQIIGIMKPCNYPTYVEPFCGACGVISQVTGVTRYASDSNKYIIALLQALQEGYVPPSDLSKDEYQAIKDNRDIFADELVGFVGFGCSFGGKWFGGYAQGGIRKDGQPRDYAAETQRNTLKLAEQIKGIKIEHVDYRSREYPIGALIYCDIPYQNTTKYAAVEDFDHAAFWLWANEKANEGYAVYVSEYAAPEGWECVWSKETTNSLDLNTGGKRGIEKLFTRRKG